MQEGTDTIMDIFPFTLLIEIICIPILVVAIFTAIADGRTPPSALDNKPNRLTSFVVPLPPEEVMKIIIKFAQQTGYCIETIAPDQGFITLSTKPTLTSWGFFYPIYLSQQADHQTFVEIGIKSRAIQIGPLVSRNHERCAAGIFAAIFAST